MLSSNEFFKKSALSLSVCALVSAAQGTYAFEGGDLLIKAGTATVSPAASSSTISVDVPALGDSGVGGVKVSDDTQLGLSLTYFVNPAVGIEVLGATPFEHDIKLPVLPSVDSSLGDKIASTKHLPPTVTVNYYMNNPQAKFQPYIGLGFNYTVFFDEKVTSNLDNAAVIDTLAGGGAITAVTNTDIDLENSFGVALHAGFDYVLTDNIGLSVSYYKIDIDTKATVTTTSTAGAYTGPVSATVNVDIDPSVLMFGLSYKF